MTRAEHAHYLTCKRAEDKCPTCHAITERLSALTLGGVAQVVASQTTRAARSRGERR